jgi:hypothetical protein
LPSGRTLRCPSKRALLANVGSRNAPCHSWAIAPGSHRRLFSIGARFIAGDLHYASRDEPQSGCRITGWNGQSQSKINRNSETERNTETPGYECPRRVAGHRSSG